MRRTGRNIFTIPPGSDFLGVLVSALMKGRLVDGFNPLDNPLLLSTATIYVPNRRAGRALSTSFLRFYPKTATVLPTIRTLGDTDDDEFGLIQSEIPSDFDANVISGLDRRLELASLVRLWQDNIAEETRRLYGDEDIRIPTSAADALYLASELSDLLTQIIQEEAGWQNIRDVVPDDHAQWWQLTSSFLRIVMEFWPEHLAELGLTDPARHALSLLKNRASMILDNPPEGPVIVAGTTGSVPSTQMMLKAVCSLRNGAVVFPGLDLRMGREEWERLKQSDLINDPLIEAQPQFGLARTLSALGVDRRDVIDLGQLEPVITERNRLVGIALSLSDFTADWFEAAIEFDARVMSEAVSDVSLIEAVNERQEALAIAVAMREVLETPSKHAALVTPDRNLARRVSRELERFGIAVDDSGGSPLISTPAAIFVRQIISVCFDTYQNPTLTSLCKNNLCLLGYEREYSFYQARLFELLMLRGTLTTPQVGGFKIALELRREELLNVKYLSPRLKAISDKEWNALYDWAKKLDTIFALLKDLKQTASGDEGQVKLGCVASVLRRIALAISAIDEEQSALSDAYGAVELDGLFEALETGDAREFLVPFSEIPSVFDTLFSDIVCRSGRTTHSRLHIFGPLEVRLLDYDRVILGGLNEDTWPQNQRSDAFLNRTIRRELGLPSPERRTGLAAHDFQQLMGKAEVILSRSGRVDKSPSVSSRWLQRLFALLGDTVSNEIRERGSRYIRYASALDHSVQRAERAKRPEPKPPVDVRPIRLPVTDIETWIRDPYALYSKHILKLRPIDPLEREPDVLLKGTLYHAIMEDYVKQEHYLRPQNTRLDALKRIATERLSAASLRDDVAMIWLLRFEEIAEKFVQWEADHLKRFGVNEIETEIKGELPFGDSFTLTARADRIERLEGNGINILDYKTGGNPTLKQARGLSPQLALEGVIAEAGGFNGIEKSHVQELMFVRLRRSKALEAHSISSRDNSLADVIGDARDNLADLILAYQSQDQGYISRYAPFKDSEMSGDYDHLARTREWSFGEEEGADD